VPMTRSPIPKTPVVSLVLLFGAYTTFSWFLHSANVSWIAWLGVISFSLLEALLLTTFSSGLRTVVRSWLESDVGYFTVVILGAFLMAVALVWIKVFSYILMVVAAELLARLDLQNAGCRRWRAFFVLTFVSFAGLAVGLIATYLPTQLNSFGEYAIAKI
jgi:hypothetical protein